MGVYKISSDLRYEFQVVSDQELGIYYHLTPLIYLKPTYHLVDLTQCHRQMLEPQTQRLRSDDGGCAGPRRAHRAGTVYI